MVERIEDPCVEQQVEQREESSESVPPSNSRSFSTPTELFPVNQREVVEQSTVRESILAEEEIVYQKFKNKIMRTGLEAMAVQEWKDNLDSVDTFRFVAGLMHFFDGNNMQFYNKTFSQSFELGTPFSIDIRSLPSSHALKERAALELTFDVDTLNRLIENKNLNLPSYEYLKGLINGFESERDALIQHNVEKLDTFFKSPAAFFLEEAEDSIIPMLETVSFYPVTGKLNLQETNQPEHKLTSVYRLYAAMLSEASADSFRETYTGDRVQKFSATSVSKINDITEQATNQNTQSQLFSRAELIMNSHVRMSMNMKHKSKICEFLTEQSLDSVLLDFLTLEEFLIEDEFVQIVDQSKYGGALNNKLTFNHKPKIYDAHKIINKMVENIDSTLDLIEKSRLQHPIPYYTVDVVEYMLAPVFDAWTTGEPQMDLADFVQNNKRNIKEILEGKPSFSEVVAYRVEKINLENTEQEVVQEFYFFNDQSTEYIDFIDSQVSYNKSYEYKIYAINAVINSKYSYSKPLEPYSTDQAKQPSPTYEFDIECESSLYFIETPYYRQQITVLDKPPLFPQPEIIPFYQDASKVAFRLTPTYGTVSDKPISILQEDEQIINKMLSTQGNPADGKIIYSGDSQPTEYEMLLIDYEPYTYKEFSNGAKFNFLSIHNSGYIELNLESNKKYYFIFRAKDNSGISNPSQVFSLVLNSHADGVYVEFDEHEMRLEDTADVLTFERILKIEPSPEQLSVNFEQHREQSNFYLSAPPVSELTLGGFSDLEHLWTNEYRFRLISRTTGKAIDLNVEYGYEIIEDRTPTNRIYFIPDYDGDGDEEISIPILQNPTSMLEGAADSQPDLPDDLSDNIASASQGIVRQAAQQDAGFGATNSAANRSSGGGDSSSGY